MATKKSAPKQAAAAKSPAKTVQKHASKAGKSAVKVPATKQVAAKQVVAKKVVAKKVVKQAAAKTVVAKKVVAKKVPAKKAVAKKAVAKKAVAKKAVAKKFAAKQVPAKKVVKQATAKAAPVKAAKTVAVKAKPPIELKAAPVRLLEPLSPPKRRSGPAVSPGTIEKLKAQLEEERARAERQADELAAEAESLATDRELGDTQFDEESGEGDTISVERERDLALSAVARHTVEEIEVALRRIAVGNYGYCLMCGDRIPVARLEAIPWADLCVKCKSRGERRR